MSETKTLSYKELMVQVAELKAQAERARLNEVSGALEKIRELIAEYELTEQDVFPSAKPRQVKESTPSAKEKKTVKAKYHDSGTFWSGRGVMPKVFREKIEAGAQLSDFVIKDPEAETTTPV